MPYKAGELGYRKVSEGLALSGYT